MDFAALPDNRSARYSHAGADADRHNRQLTTAQRRQRVQAVARHLPNGADDQSAPTPRGGTVGAGSVYVQQDKSLSSMTMNRPAANLDYSAAAPGAADQRQAGYFVRVLTEYRRRIDDQIDKYQRIIAMCEAGGDVYSARGVRHRMRIEMQDRQILGGLIYRLQQRFPVHAASERPAVAQTARLVVR